MKKAGTCVHFNGTFRKACRLRIVYQTVARSMTTTEQHMEDAGIETPLTSLTNRLPCFRANNINTCSKYTEEIES